MRLRTNVLEIRRHDDAYSFSLRRPGKPLMGPTLQEWQVRVAPDIVRALSRTIRDAVEAANEIPCPPGSTHNAFVEVGTNLYRQFLPAGDRSVADLRKQLRKLKSPLLITTDEPGVCWELLYDDEGGTFLCLKHSVGRCLITRAVPSAQPRGERAWRCLMIASSTPHKRRDPLPETAAEAALLRDWLVSRNVKHIDFFEGPDATLEALLGALGRHEYDIIHYAGHTELDRQSGEYGLVLHGGKLFLAGGIERAVRGNPIVFLNGCWTGIAKGTANSEGSVEGLTDAFLGAGAQLVVGSQFEAPDAGARAFAEKFYEAVLEGHAAGEAMRLARLHVKERIEYAATWACFVMYGDPSLRLNLQNDPLAKLLASIAMKRDDFEEPCLRVVEQALDYAGKSFMVATGELFAALVDSESGWLRDRLKEQNVPVEALAQAFKSVLKKINERARGSTRYKRQIDPSFSDNAREMMQEARAEAETARRSISEHDLIKGFVKKQGGSTGEVLRKLRVDIPKIVDGNGGDGDDYGYDYASGYSADARKALETARTLARRSRHALVTTLHLFFGLLQNGQGPLAKALRRFNISISTDEPVSALDGESQRTSVRGARSIGPRHSDNVGAILKTAQEMAQAAGGSRVTEEDLLVAFVHCGGGSTAKTLAQKGIVLEALTSKLFLDSGELDSSRVSIELLSAVAKGNAIREEKGHAALGRRHLFYAMLASEETLLSKCLHSQGQNGSRLAELLYAELPARPSKSKVGTTSQTKFASTLVQVLCTAEAEAKKLQQCRIGEAQFAWTLVKYGGREIQQFLANQGVRLSALMSCLEVHK